MKIKCRYKKCNKFFQKRISNDPRSKNKFCSSICALGAVRTKKHQIEAGKKGALTNILRYRGTGVRGYVRENGENQHRVVMERKIGRKLRKGEIVHHKDGDKKNNSIRNLQLLKNQSEHIKLHLKLGNGKL